MKNQQVMNNQDILDLKAQKKANKIKNPKTDIVYFVICGLILFLLAVIIIYPLYYIIIASISDPDAVMTGDVWLYPVKVTFSGYGHLFKNSDIWRSYGNTLLYTLLGTAFNIVLTIPAGWALSRDYLPFRKLIMVLLIITMFFGGGLVPYIILCRSLGLYENPLILIIGGGVSVYNVFMCKSFFTTNVPKEVLEAAEIDGAGEVRTFFDLVLPLAKSIISVMVLFYAVGHWNNYIDAYIFNIDQEFYPLQTILNELLAVTKGGEGDVVLEQMRAATQIKFTSIIVATVPILILYPMIEKHFGQGVLVGSFK
ncbi:MAG: carbohydrate ABC transporter permease [Clostridiales bacterium]|nr:carbohydrate ABC transporter permease [Clostridiales bacterium]